MSRPTSVPNCARRSVSELVELAPEVGPAEQASHQRTTRLSIGNPLGLTRSAVATRLGPAAPGSEAASAPPDQSTKPYERRCVALVKSTAALRTSAKLQWRKSALVKSVS